MDNHDKNTAVYTKETLIKSVASKCGKKISTVKDVIGALEDEIAKLLAEADEQTDIVLRPFSGISISSTLAPEREKVNNFTGEMTVYAAKIKPKASITRHYCDLINANGK